MPQIPYIKKLIYVASHRGTKENDLLLAPFARSQLESLSSQELHIFETFLQERDDDIFGWLMGHTPPPDHYKGLCRLIIQLPIISK